MSSLRDPTWRSLEVEDGAATRVEEWLNGDTCAPVDRDAVRALVEENARLRSVLGHCPKGIAVLDERGNLHGYNREFVELLGREPSLGAPFEAHLEPTDRELLHGVVRRAGTTRRAAAVLRTAREGDREIEILAATLPSSTPRSIGVVLAAEDRSATGIDEDDREALSKANVHVGLELGASHLREQGAPHCAAALRAIAVLRTKLDGDVGVALALAELEPSVRALDALLSRPKPRDIAPRRRAADVGTAAHRAVRLAARGRGGRLAAVDVRVDDDLTVSVPEPELVQLLANVVSAGVRGIEEANRFGWIVVSAEKTDRGTVEIAVRDDGDGLAASHLQRCFGSSGTSELDGDGRALGLTLARGMVEAAGGSMRALTEKGHGTTVVIELPRA